MADDATTEGMMPPRAQWAIAFGVATALAAILFWYLSQGGLSGGLVHHDTPPPAVGLFTVNVNETGVDELAVLPGLGPATARRIVDHRREHGPFASLDALLDVPGIGPATLDGLRPHLRPIRRRQPTP